MGPDFFEEISSGGGYGECRFDADMGLDRVRDSDGVLSERPYSGSEVSRKVSFPWLFAREFQARPGRCTNFYPEE